MATPSSSMPSPSQGFQFSSLFAGYFVGHYRLFRASAVIVSHPFDSLKVRMQIGKVNRSSSDGLLTASETSSSSSSLRVIARNLYRGILPPLLTVGTIQSINLSCYETIRAILHNKHYGGNAALVPDSRVS